MRRSTSNAKIAEKYERRRSARAAADSSNRFTSKQSPFQLRHEELQQQQHQQQDFSSTGGGNPTPFVSRVIRTPTARSSDFMSTNTHSSKPIHTTAAIATKAAPATSVSTTASATLGLAPIRQTRRTRRVDKFRLSETDPLDHGHSGHSRKRGRSDVSSPTADEADPRNLGLGQGLLGAVRRPPHADAVDGDEDPTAPPARRTKHERFAALVADSRGQRALAQQDRATRLAETSALDAAFDGVAHLLQTRSRVAEERARFEQSGTPQVRALLQEMRANRPARALCIRSDGTFTVNPLAETAGAETGVTADPTATTTTTATTADTEQTHATNSKRAKTKGSNHNNNTTVNNTKKINKDTPAMNIPSPPEGAEKSAAKTVPPMSSTEALADVDDFDRLLVSMRQDTRRAVAGERTLTESELAERAAAAARIASDRATVPMLPGATEADRIQLTRAEWIARGGDVAHQIDSDADDQDEDEDEYEYEAASDGLDIDSVASVLAVDNVDGLATGTANEEDFGSEEDHDVERQGGPLEDALTALDHFSRTVDGSRAARVKRNAEFTLLLRRLHAQAAAAPRLAARTFRLLLIDAQRDFLRRRQVKPAALVCLCATSRVFPTSDYRHEVTTPLLLFLSASLLQGRLDSCEAARRYACVAGLLTSMLMAQRGGGKFASEVVVAALNLLALQLPRRCLEPTRLQGLRVPFPLVEREEEVVLSTSQTSQTTSTTPTGEANGQERNHSESDAAGGGLTSGQDASEAVQQSRKTKGKVNDKKSKSNQQTSHATIEETHAETTTTSHTVIASSNDKENHNNNNNNDANNHSNSSAAVEGTDEVDCHEPLCILETDVTPTRVVLYAYHLLSTLADMYGPIPAIPAALLEPFEALHHLLHDSTHWQPAPIVRMAHNALYAKLQALDQAARDTRTPLAMRTFRPRPIRQFEPLLQAAPTSAMKEEARQVRRELREDRKRVVRQLQAEAAVERRQREREQGVVDAQRDKQYRNVMAQLQAQQHTMNTVDGLMQKSRSKKRSGFSGAATSDQGEAGDE